MKKSQKVSEQRKAGLRTTLALLFLFFCSNCARAYPADGFWAIITSSIISASNTGTTPYSFGDGPTLVDPFGDGVPAGQFFVFNGKLHLGPNSTHDRVFEMSFDFASTGEVSLDGDGVPGTPLSSFAGLPNASGTNLAGIDFFYSACVGVSPATLTGAACSGAGGNEYNFIGAYITGGGNFESIWSTTDTGNTRTYTQTSSLESGSGSYRSNGMGLFKEQLYISIIDTAGNAIRFSRVCMKLGGCANGDTFAQVTKLTGDFLNHMGRHGTNNNGNGNILGIDTFWEYDNDGTGINPSQFYIANGGATGALPQVAGGTIDGGILRTSLTRSVANNPPPGCSGAGVCDTYWEDVTPTNLKWLTYMSVALPATVGTEWPALIPPNTITPAIKAVPAMRTASNGDLYLIRNACSTSTVQTGGAFGVGGSQTCPQGSEVPQLWVLPAGSSATPKGAGDWILVAETGATGRSDMSAHSSCIAGVNRCDSENTHITLLETNDTFLYIGFDNATHGVNIWRVDLAGITSGTAPSVNQFDLVGGFGLADNTANTRLFSSASLNVSGSDHLIVLTGNGTGPLSLYRTDNNN